MRGGREDAKPNSLEENSILWDMMDLEHDTGATLEIATTSTKSGWSVRVPDMVIDKKKGKQGRPPCYHQILAIIVRADASDYRHIDLPDPYLRSTRASAVCDNGAQFCFISKVILYSCGLKPKHIIPMSKNINTISGEGIEILGAVFLRVSFIDGNGKLAEAPIMVYFTDSTARFYLFKQAVHHNLECISNTGDIRS